MEAMLLLSLESELCEMSPVVPVCLLCLSLASIEFPNPLVEKKTNREKRRVIMFFLFSIRCKSRKFLRIGVDVDS